MRPDDQGVDPEDTLARLSQEATNQSTPDKALTDQPPRRNTRRRMARRRPKAAAGN